jgi:hypothetical protein
MEQKRNRTRSAQDLTPDDYVYTNTPCMGRPPKPEALRRSKVFLLRLTPGELSELQSIARSRGETLSDVLRKGAQLYAERSKDGSLRKEKMK